MKYFILSIVAMLLCFIILQARISARDTALPGNARRVLLLGASVGYGWSFSEWPQRMKDNRFALEMVAEYSFDKREALEEILMRPKRKFHFTKTYIKGFFQPPPKRPDAVIIKECAAYFPGDLAKYKVIIGQMVARCKESNVIPVLATVVPVTERHSQEKPGRLQSILEYNDWAKEFAKANNTKIIDLESFLRVSEKNRALSLEFTSGDGLHLNKQAYDLMDLRLAENLQAIFM